MRCVVWQAGIVLLAICLTIPHKALAQSSAADLGDVLGRLEQAQATRNAQQGEREASFRRARDRQQARLAQAQATLDNEEARALRLEQAFKDNEQQLAELEALLQERLGVYGEVFGVMRQLARRVHGDLVQSLRAGYNQADIALLDELAKSQDLPSQSQLNALWQAIQREMKAQGDVATFTAPLQDEAGQLAPAVLTRFGPFSIVHGDKFLRRSDDERFVPLAQQPPRRFRAALRDYFASPPDSFAPAVIDPTRGALLDIYVRTPSLLARIGQGGIVGYIILLLGTAGLGLAAQRLWWLTRQNRLVRQELAKETPSANDSALGRVWRVYEAYQNSPHEDLQRQLDAAILQELPPLERGLTLLKLLAGLAPLLGLLGTVTGMILTFQAISLFGSGDPKLMAGGISQALMTTVLGLCVAIPLLLLHSLAHTRARAIMQILDEQVLGLIARHKEARK